MSMCESHGWPLLFSSLGDRTGENRVPDRHGHAIRALNEAYKLIYRAMHTVCCQWLGDAGRCGVLLTSNDVSGPCLRAFFVRGRLWRAKLEIVQMTDGISPPDHRPRLRQCPSIPQYAWTQHPVHCPLHIEAPRRPSGQVQVFIPRRCCAAQPRSSMNLKHAAGLLRRSDPTDLRTRCSAQIPQMRQPEWSIKPPIPSLLLTRGCSHFQNKARKYIRTLSVPAYAERMIANVHPPDVVLELDGMQMAGAGELSRSNIVTAQRVHISAC